MIARPKLFDANAHPTLDGRWIDGKRSCCFDRMERDLIEAGFGAAAAVALPGTPDFDDARFIDRCRQWRWIPVASWSPRTDENALERMQALVKAGYRAVKLHPRLAGWHPAAEELARMLIAAQACRLPAMLCTYPTLPAEKGPYVDLLPVIHEALRIAPRAPLMLMHAGTVELLRYIEFARANPNIVLDLSFTMMKYKQSSVDQDLMFAFRNFDRRIVIGSDAPEFSPATVASRFDELAAGVSDAQRENIAWNNAANFFGQGAIA